MAQEPSLGREGRLYFRSPGQIDYRRWSLGLQVFWSDCPEYQTNKIMKKYLYNLAKKSQIRKSSSSQDTCEDIMNQNSHYHYGHYSHYHQSNLLPDIPDRNPELPENNR